MASLIINIDLNEVSYGDLEALESLSLREMKKFFMRFMVDETGKKVTQEEAKQYIEGLKGEKLKEFGLEVRKALKELETQAVGGPFGNES